MFQFQTGSIKSPVIPPANEIEIGFQFQTGSIKSQPLQVSACFQRRRFNSKLVRLKVIDFVSGRIRMQGFQFQTGSIKSLYMVLLLLV